MGKTYKKFNGFKFRRPKGFKNAVINNARLIPPDDWEDLSFDPQCYLPLRAAGDMLSLGIPFDIVVRKLCNKFHLSHHDAKKIVEAA